jgi:hypothetical protein
VLTAGTPAAVALFCRSGIAVTVCPLRLLGVIPEPAAREVAHHDVAVLARQLIEGRQQFLAFMRAKRRRLPVDENGPIGVARGHGEFLKFLNSEF